MPAKAAIVPQDGDSDRSRAHLNGLRAQFETMGAGLAIAADASFQSERQTADVEVMLSQKPDVLASTPVDVAGMPDACRAAARQGVHLVFIDDVLDGMRAGTAYFSCVSTVNFGGVAAANLLDRATGGGGEIGLVGDDAMFFATRQQLDGFRSAMPASYPRIRIAGEVAVAGPDFRAQADVATTKLFTMHPAVDGIWVVWDVPAEGVLAAARRAGRSDLKVATHDLGAMVANEMAQGNLIVGVIAQRCYEQGLTEALLTDYALLGKTAPSYLTLPMLAVDCESLPSPWQIVTRRTFSSEPSTSDGEQ